MDERLATLLATQMAREHAPIRETQEQDEAAAEELQLQLQRSFGCAFWWERREEELKVKYCSSRIC
jgi:hypothetical protein